MRAVLLAAGKGTRLGKLSNQTPKPMLEINGKPIIEHNIEWVKKHGITDIYVNLHHLSDVITEHLGDGDRFGVNIEYSRETELLGTAGAVRKIADEFWTEEDKNESFLVVYADNLHEYDVSGIIRFHEKQKGVATIALYEKDDVSQSGIVFLDEEGGITRFIEKPAREERLSKLVNTGFYVLNSAVFQYIEPRKYIDFGKNVFPLMLDKGERLYGMVIKGNLTPVDTPELFNMANINS